MKRILIFIFMLLLAACTKPEIAKEIYFSQAELTTRSTIINDNIFPITWSFGVAATWTGGTANPGNDNSDPDGTFENETPKDYFSGIKEATHLTTDTGSYWGLSNIYYWPKSGTMKFRAYAPYTQMSADGTLSYTSGASDIITFTPGSGYSVDSYDILYAEAIGIDCATYSDETQVPLALTFNHTLAQVQFDIKKSTLLSSTEVKLIGISFKVPGSKATSLENGVWKGISTAKTYAIGDLGFTANTALSSTAIVGNQLLVLPQALSGSDMVHLEYSSKVFGWTRNHAIDVPYSSFGVANWEAGKKYVYHIIIDSREILFAASVGSWDNVTETTIY